MATHGGKPAPVTEDWKRVFAKVLIRMPNYVRLGWKLARSSEIPRRHKAGLLGGVLYQLAPVDLVPNIIPVLGQLDDVGVLLYGIRSALRHCPPDLAAQLMSEYGVSEAQLNRDISAMNTVARGFGRLIARGAWRGGKATARVLGRGVAAGATLAWAAYRRHR
ncbi:MAG TPA: YkvA family protein [Armatimonadota bacterium]